MGRAVYACTLPIDAGLALYRRLQCTIEAGLPLGATVHEGYIPLTFLIIQVPIFSVHVLQQLPRDEYSSCALCGHRWGHDFAWRPNSEAR